MNRQEEWRDVSGTQSLYQVSNYGRIRSLKWGRITMLKLSMTAPGYYRISLSVLGKVRYQYVHRLVVETFIGHHPYKNVINHIDGNKLNNRVENLEWVTQSENAIHSHIRLLGEGIFPVSHMRKITDDQVLEIVKSAEKPKDIAKKYGISTPYIYRIRNGRERHHAQGRVYVKKKRIARPFSETEWNFCG